MEDIIFVTGCTMVTSWAIAAFVNATIDAEISLAIAKLDNGGTTFDWRNVEGFVVHYNSLFDPVRTPAYVYSTCTNFSCFHFSFFILLYGKQNPTKALDQCVFIRGFRAKRRLFRAKALRAAAEPRPDDPDNRRDDEIQMTRVTGAPKVSALPYGII